MNKLNSLQLTTSTGCSNEGLGVVYSNNPLAFWTSLSGIVVRNTSGPVWFPENPTGYVPFSAVKLATSPNNNYLLFYLDSSSNLVCIEFSQLDSSFYPPVTVANDVQSFDITPASSVVVVAISRGDTIYTVTRDEDSRVWVDPVSTIVASGDVTSVSIDYKEPRMVIAYTTSVGVYVYQDPEDLPFPSVTVLGTPSDVKVRMVDDTNFDVIFNDQVVVNRSIQHAAREDSTFWESQIIDDTADNYNIDLYDGDKVCVVWNDGSYVRYREKSGVTWIGLGDSAYVASCDVDSTPKVIYYQDYSRVIYKKSGAVYYAGMPPMTQEITANFNCSIWGGTKLIDESNTSISSSPVENRISQRVVFQQRNLSIGDVSCYLKKYSTDDSVWNMFLDLYYSDINGNPYADPIATASISSTAVSSAGWYNFSFGLNGLLAPIDGYCFVMRQVGGDERNYISWLGYKDGGQNARISKDSKTWVMLPNITRSLRVSGNFNAFEKIINDDPAKITHQFITPPASAAEGQVYGYNDLAGGTFDNTYLINVKEPSYYQYPEVTYYLSRTASKNSRTICLTESEVSTLHAGDQIYITNNQNVMQYNYITAIGTDGCVTVRDELIIDYTVEDDSRIIVPIVTEYVNQNDRIYGYAATNVDWRVAIKQKNAIISFVVDSSGSMGWNDLFGIRKKVTEALISRLGAATGATILFDFVKFGGLLVDNIDTQFQKRTQAVTVDIDSPTSVYGYDQNGNPITDTDAKLHLASGVVAFGYKDLKDGANYIIKGIDLGWTSYYNNSDTVSSLWHSLWTSGSPSFSVEENGPENEQCLNVSVSDASKAFIRYYAAGYDDSTNTTLVNPVSVDDLVVDVSDLSGFITSGRLNILDENSIDNFFYIESVDGLSNRITLSRKLHYNMAVSSTRVETADSNYLQTGWGNSNTIDFYIVDPTQSGTVTFFIQTFDGATIEYEVTPMSGWVTYNLYYLDETARFDINAVNSEGEDIPDGTMVEFYVNKKPDLTPDEDKSTQTNLTILRNALVGSSLIYLSSTDILRFARGDKVEITDDSKTYGGVAASAPYFGIIVEINKVNNFLVVSPIFEGDFLVSRNARVVFPATKVEQNSFALRNQFDISANLVNVTPIYTGEKLPDNMFGDTDPPQVEPTDTYDQHNTDPTRVVRNSIEVLTTNGWAAARLLPVTEDKFVTEDVKTANAVSLFAKTAREQIAESGVAPSSSSGTSSSSSSSSSKQYWIGSKDYTMEDPVYVYNGYTYTTMQSNARSLGKLTYGGKEYLAKKYTIYPVMTFFKENGQTIAQMSLPEYEVAFACPARMTSETSDLVSFSCVTAGPDAEPYDQSVCGTYALSGSGVQITYKVYSKDFPVSQGNLQIYVYDDRRDKNTAYVLDQDLGDVSGCGDTASASGGEMGYYAVQDNGTDPFDETVANKLLATDYLSPSGMSATTTIPIVNGVATFTLPALSRMAKFTVYAAYQVTATSRIIHAQTVYYRSPLVLTYTGPNELSNDGSSTYNLSARLSWMNVSPVDDGTIVNFSASGGELNPSVSETVNGVAQGVVFRPISQPAAAITRNSSGQDISQNVQEQTRVKSRTVTVESTYRGFYAKVSATLKVQDEENQDVATFYYIARASPERFFADGIDYTMVVADLQASSNRGFPFIDTIGPDLVSKKAVVFFGGSGLSIQGKTAKWSATPPPEGTYDIPDDMPGYAWNRLYSNQFIGRPKFFPAPETDGPPPCNYPDCIEINSYTMSSKYSILGYGIDSDTVSFVSETITGTQTIPKPRVGIVEPLGINLSFEPVDRSNYQTAEWRSTPLGSHPSTYAIDQYSHPLKRDGEAKFYVVAEVTWRDSFIRSYINNPFPTVSFSSGKCVIESSKDAYSVSFVQDNSFHLDANTAIVSISRTTFDEDHFHECYVGDDGKGKTTSTVSYVEGIVVPDHIHDIDINSSPYVSVTSFSRSTTDGSGNTVTIDVNHNHTPRSVAIVSSGPVADLNLEICVKGVVTYDNGKVKSDNTRVTRTLENYAFSYPVGTSGGSSGGVYSKKYLLEIFTDDVKSGDSLVPGFYTSMNKDAAGQTIRFSLTYKDENGVSLPVANGTRIFASFKFFEPPARTGEENRKDVLVIEQGKTRDYAIMEINARASGLPVEVVATKQVLIESNFNWYAIVSNGGFDPPTNDSVYLNNAISSITEFGGSQVADAVIYAANRLIQAGADYNSWCKVIILISDGSDNMSENSEIQAIESVDSINGDNESNIFSVKLSDTDGFDAVMMQKYSAGTDGQYFKIGQVSGDVDTTVDRIVDSILGSEKFRPLSGTYTNVIDLGESKTFTGIRLGVLMKPGTQIRLRVRFSVSTSTAEEIVYGEWMSLPTVSYSGVDVVEWINIDVSGAGRYMQYEATLLGDVDTFQSPQMAGLAYEYYEPGRYTMFFQPMSIEKPNYYVGEVIFMHEGTIPSTSTIKYGITHNTTTDFVSWYSSTGQPNFRSGVSAFVLSRYNEKTTTLDYRTYVAVNGGWNDSYTVDVYRISPEVQLGELVDKNQYIVDSKTGSIIFNVQQLESSEFVIVVSLKPYFRFAVDTVNYGTQSVTLDNLSIMYNLVDRLKLSYPGDHRDVSSLTETNYRSFGITSSGTLSESNPISNSNIGTDSDILTDISSFQVTNTVAAFNGVRTYMIDLLKNFSVDKTYELDGGPDFVPVSASYDSNYWYFVERTSSGCSVHKYDESFKYVYTSVYPLDFLESGDTFLNTRRYGSFWYMTEKDRIHVLNRSFALEQTILLPFSVSGVFVLDDSNFWLVSQARDFLWQVNRSGAVVGGYEFGINETANNLSILDKAFYIVKSSYLALLSS